jgi:uncharacterized protein
VPGGTLAPGVYRQQVAPAAPVGPATGVPLFLGYAEAGPVETPTAVPSLAAFAAQFTAGPADGYLADAVQGFFANGGAQCVVVRLDDAAPAHGALRDGLAAAAGEAEVDLVCAPDVMRPGVSTGLDPDEVLALQTAVLDDCERDGTRIALLDALPATAAAVLAQVEVLARDFGALYHPWIAPVAGRFVPPSGAVAGVIAQTDAAAGVHKPPANVALAAAIDLAAALDGPAQALLNAAGVNCLRAFPGRGIRVWGARTTSRDPAWRYLNVRRVVLTAARWTAGTTRDLAFEPHGPQLWARVTRALSAYAADLYRRGALSGATADAAFSVRCDATTNPPEVRASGRLVAELALAPSSTREVIVIRIVRHAAGVTIETAAPTG